MRALAVVAVLLDHALAWPSGGFVGVDVFFVISGFLITGLLLREYEKRSSISFTGFYWRRVRRIMPAAFVVLVATVVGARLLISSARFDGVVWDALSSLLFASNWRFAAIGTDYFQASGPVSPLQHFWSLSVEEQFYFVWPILMLIALTLASRRGSKVRPRVVVGTVIGVLAVASFIWALHDSSADPTVAYFSTFSRSWELSIGALLAILAPLLRRILPSWLRPILAYVGLAGIVVSLFTVSQAGGFPAPLAAFPTLAAALVIAAGTGGTRRILVPLDNPVARYLGDISYSLYLWHFPVIIVFGPYLLHLLGGNATWLYYTIVIALSIALAGASYHFIEDPIRRAKWLDLGAGRRSGGGSRAAYLGLAGAAAATAVVLAVALSFNTLTGATAAADSAASAAEPNSPDTSTTSGQGDAQAALSAEITASLAAKSWPSDLAPVPGSADNESLLPKNDAKCGSFEWLAAEDCTYGDPAAPRHAILVGDSIAQSYVPALAQLFGQGDWSLRIVSMYACPFVDAKVGDNPSRMDICEDRKLKEYDAIRSTQPDLVIISSTDLRATDLTTGVKATLSTWNGAFQSMISKVAPDTKKVLLLPPAPPDKDITACYTPFSAPSDCVSSTSNSEWVSMANFQKSAVEAVGGVFIDNRSWYCDASGNCPAFVGSTLMKKDQAHITPEYALKLVSVMRDAFVKAGILDQATG